MGASNRHGGMKLPRRVKVLFMKQTGKHDVFRNYFGVKKPELVDGAPAATSTPAASEAPKA
jgi:hypothetical protein